MTEQQIIEWAREISIEDILTYTGKNPQQWLIDALGEFAVLATGHAKAEMKKRCAKVCSDVSNKSGGEQYDMFGNNLAEQCENAIRALKD